MEIVESRRSMHTKKWRKEVGSVEVYARLRTMLADKSTYHSTYQRDGNVVGGKYVHAFYWTKER